MVASFSYEQTRERKIENKIKNKIYYHRFSVYTFRRHCNQFDFHREIFTYKYMHTCTVYIFIHFHYFLFRSIVSLILRSQHFFKYTDHSTAFKLLPAERFAISIEFWLTFMRSMLSVKYTIKWAIRKTIEFDFSLSFQSMVPKLVLMLFLSKLDNILTFF